MRFPFFEDAKNADRRLRKEFNSIIWNGPNRWLTISCVTWMLLPCTILFIPNKPMFILLWIIIGVLFFGPIYIFWLQDYWLKKWNNKISKESKHHKGSIQEARLKIFEKTLFENKGYSNDEKLLVIDRSIHETNISKPKFRSWSYLVQFLSLGGVIGLPLFTSIDFNLSLDEIAASFQNPGEIKFLATLLFLYLVFVGFFYVLKQVVLEISNNQLNKVNRIILMLESVKSKLLRESLNAQ